MQTAREILIAGGIGMGAASAAVARPIHGPNHAEIIGQGDDNANNRHQSQPIIGGVAGGAFHHRQEQKQFAGKARQRRNARQRDHRHRHRGGQEGRTLMQSRQRADVVGFAADQADDNEGGAEGEQVADEVIKDRRRRHRC